MLHKPERGGRRSERSSASPKDTKDTASVHPNDTPNNLPPSNSPAEAIAEIRAILRSHETSLRSYHDSIGGLRERLAGQETKLGVITTELRETREDISEMKRAFERGVARIEATIDSELASTRRAIWGLAAGVASTFVALAIAAAQLVIS